PEMSLSYWLRSLRTKLLRRSVVQLADRRNRRARLRVEELESRLVPSGASNDHTVLILGSSVVGTREATAASNRGFTVETASDAAWLAKTQADFASYRAILIGDDQCTPSGVLVAVQNASTWGPVVNGNMFITGADPEYHSSFGNNNAGA